MCKQTELMLKIQVIDRLVDENPTNTTYLIKQSALRKEWNEEMMKGVEGID